MTEADKSEMNEKRSISEKEAHDFASANVVPLERTEIENGEKKPHEADCMDGRKRGLNKPEKKTAGVVHLAGGDVGVLESVAATLEGSDNDPGNVKIVSAFVDAKKALFGEDARIGLHTDEYAGKAGGIGCGHANRMSSNKPEYNGDGKYGLTWARAKDLFEIAWTRSEAEHVVLEGTHEELGVMFVHGVERGKMPYFSINPFDGNRGESYFVIDEEATEEYFRTLIPKMSEILEIDLPIENVLSNYIKQRDISAGLLAGHLEKYDVYIESAGKVKVEKAS